MQKRWLYIMVIAGSIAGLSWVGWNVMRHTLDNPATGVDVCLFRRVTGLPCPSCGSTRSVMHIAHLQFGDALRANPIGFLLVIGMIVFPLWVAYDLAVRKATFYSFYITSETVIRKRWVAITLILLLTANWAWNIYKFTA